MATAMPKRFWTPEEEAHLRQHYADTLTAELAQHYGRPVKQTSAKANSLGLKKSVALIAETARQRSMQIDHASRKTRFKVGLVPWNKGTHFTAGGRSAETRFSAGMKPHTWVPVGSYRIIPDEGCGILEQKMNDMPGPNGVRWKAVHRLVWEKEIGPIPSGHVVVFRPGQKTTDIDLITPERLECIDRKALMQRNSVHRYPKEIASAVQLLGALKRRIREAAEKEPA